MSLNKKIIIEKKDIIFSLLMIILIIAIVGFLVYNFILSMNVLKIKNNKIVIQSKTDKYIISKLPNDPVKGNFNSSIAIYLFADYESPEIINLLDIIDQLIIKYSSDLHFVWKDLPLPKHYFAKGAALAARCALDENKYWEYNNRLLKNKSLFSLKVYQQIAEDLKMNVSNFLTCYKSGKYLYDIENNIQEAYVLDIKKIPTIFINQKRIDGDYSLENLDRIISNLIK